MAKFNLRALIDASEDLTKFEIEVMVEKLAEWVGEDVTPDQLRAIVWAMAVDHDFEALVRKAMRAERRELSDLGGEEV